MAKSKGKVKKINIMKNVQFSDLVRIDIFEVQPRNFVVNLECIDKTKKVIFDTDSLKVFNHKLTEKCQQMVADDPKTRLYIEEFTARMVNELYRNGLVGLEDIGEAKEDYYADLRKQFPCN